MNAEQLAQLKARPIVDNDRGEPTVLLTAQELRDLIAEVERQAEYIADLKHDMDATIKAYEEHDPHEDCL